MKQLIFSLLLGIGLAFSSLQAQPIPLEKDLTLTTAFTTTDSLLVLEGYVPVAVYTQDITNATSFNVQVCFERVPVNWYTILEIGTATDYVVSIADSSIAPLDANTIMPVLGKSKTSTNWMWIRLSGITAEAADKVFTVRLRYI